jgi:hypothetical protein
MKDIKEPNDKEKENGFVQTKGQSEFEGWGQLLKPSK